MTGISELCTQPHMEFKRVSTILSATADGDINAGDILFPSDRGNAFVTKCTPQKTKLWYKTTIWYDVEVRHRSRNGGAIRTTNRMIKHTDTVLKPGFKDKIPIGVALTSAKNEETVLYQPAVRHINCRCDFSWVI